MGEPWLRANDPEWRWVTCGAPHGPQAAQLWREHGYTAQFTRGAASVRVRAAEVADAQRVVDDLDVGRVGVGPAQAPLLDAQHEVVVRAVADGQMSAKDREVAEAVYGPVALWRLAHRRRELTVAEFTEQVGTVSQDALHPALCSTIRLWADLMAEFAPHEAEQVMLAEELMPILEEVAVSHPLAPVPRRWRRRTEQDLLTRLGQRRAAAIRALRAESWTPKPTAARRLLDTMHATPGWTLSQRGDDLSGTAWRGARSLFSTLVAARAARGDRRLTELVTLTYATLRAVRGVEQRERAATAAMEVCVLPTISEAEELDW